uniref:Ig-like domain-containing protein n=1 Tax=Anabas testudineus TaxID=64144 RepID=A0A7N6C540_ANATE
SNTCASPALRKFIFYTLGLCSRYGNSYRLTTAVGEKVTFTTAMTPPVTPFLVVTWSFVDSKDDNINIITSSTEDITGPAYTDRITLFRSTGSLELRNLTLHDGGEYNVLIIPDGQVQQKGSCRLEMHVPVSNVTVTVSNTDLVEFNSSVSLSCSSSGSSLSFLWLNGSSEVTASDRVQFTDGNSTLTVINVTRYDQGPFRCRVSNPVSDGTSDPVNLSISFGPENINLTPSPSEEWYDEGSDISLICSADSRPAALFYWFLNGSLLSDTGAELINIQMSQSGNYSCRAFNNKTLRYETSQVSAVTALGVTISSPAAVLIEDKSSTNLTCEASGSISSTVWMKDGKSLYSSNRVSFSVDNRVVFIQPVHSSDRGTYQCQASNPVSTMTAAFNLTVNFGPHNVSIIGPSAAPLGQRVTLQCTAESVPPANFSWMFNGKETPVNNSVYIIEMLGAENTGNYTCLARNMVTTLENSTVLNLKGKKN